MSYDPEAHAALCQNCPLRGSVVVPPEGPQNPEAVIVGEGPGRLEVQQKRPFVGPSGVALEEILWKVGLSRKQVWVSNTTLCQPDVPGLRTAKRYDMNTYMAWLRKENTKRRKEAKANGTDYQPIMSPIDACAPRLWGELAYFDQQAIQRGQPNGAVVIPLGNYAAHAIVQKTGIQKIRGSWYKVNFGDPPKDETA